MKRLHATLLRSGWSSRSAWRWCWPPWAGSAWPRCGWTGPRPRPGGRRRWKRRPPGPVADRFGPGAAGGPGERPALVRLSRLPAGRPGLQPMFKAIVPRRAVGALAAVGGHAAARVWSTSSSSRTGGSPRRRSRRPPNGRWPCRAIVTAVADRQRRGAAGRVAALADRAKLAAIARRRHRAEPVDVAIVAHAVATADSAPWRNRTRPRR